MDENKREVDKSDNGTGPTGGVRLKRQLTLTNGVAITLSIIIGSGIFLSPKGVLLNTGSVGLSLIVWGLSGVLSTLGALCYVELGTTIPKSGGTYTYLYEIYGPWVAFMRVWQSMVISSPAAGAVLSMTVASYVLYPFFAPCPAPYMAVRLIAALVLGLTAFLNCYSVRLAARVNNVLTVLKVGALVVIIVFGGIRIANGYTEYLQPSKAFEGTTSDVGTAVLSFYSALWAFNGWNLVLNILISMPLVTIVYILTNVAYFTAMTPGELLASDAVAVTFANRTMGSVSWIIPVAVAISTFATKLTGTLAFSRGLMVASRHGILPRIMSMIQVDRLTPVPAILPSMFLGWIMLMSDDVYKLLSLLGFVGWLSNAVVVTGLVWWRFKKPDLPRPVKLNLAIPIIFVLMCVFMVVVPFMSAPVECGMGLAVLVSGIPVYAVFFYWENKPDWLLSFEAYVTSRLQMALNVVPQDQEEKLN